MSLPEIVEADQWLTARRELLKREKELTRLRDQLNTDRRMLPMTRVSVDYRFTGPHGEVSLRDLFAGRRQLVVQHFMFPPEWEAGCPGCTAGADDISEGLLRHLAARHTTFVAISRAPYAKIASFIEGRRWPFGFYSSFGSSFNYDFHVSLDESVAPVMYNYRDAEGLKAAGMAWATEGPVEQPGVSCFLRDGDDVFHTYSTYGRGTEQVGGAYSFLDLTALGRQETWELPSDRVETPYPAMADFAE
ncbi:MAG TPA: DUF899 domain-containing protein [Pseudonocardiaceae bacterium]|nr:DUF899 domain-containing protein [Pseudonocardiaceae bacterium]